jgi:hypothetical protein
MPKHWRNTICDPKPSSSMATSAIAGEEQHFLGEDEEAEIEYGVDENGSSLEGKIRGLCEEIGERRRAKILGEERQKRLV